MFDVNNASRSLRRIILITTSLYCFYSARKSDSWNLFFSLLKMEVGIFRGRNENDSSEPKMTQAQMDFAVNIRIVEYQYDEFLNGRWTLDTIDVTLALAFLKNNLDQLSDKTREMCAEVSEIVHKRDEFILSCRHLLHADDESDEAAMKARAEEFEYRENIFSLKHWHGIYDSGKWHIKPPGARAVVRYFRPHIDALSAENRRLLQELILFIEIYEIKAKETNERLKREEEEEHRAQVAAGEEYGR